MNNNIYNAYLQLYVWQDYCDDITNMEGYWMTFAIVWREWYIATQVKA